MSTPFNIESLPRSARVYFGRNRVLPGFALALFAAATYVQAATQGSVGRSSTASIGIYLEVRPYIHARQMSLSTLGGNPVPSSSGRRLCLTMHNVAGFTLNALAHGDARSRLTPVVLDDATDCGANNVGLTLPRDNRGARQPVVWIIAPI